MYTRTNMYIIELTNCISPRRPLKDGDIVNIDITVYLDGYHGDNSKTFLVGDVVRLPSIFCAS